MKKLTLLFLLFSCIAASQENFIIKNNNITWSKTYKTIQTTSEINLALLKINANTTTNNNIIQFAKEFSSKELEPFGFTSNKFPTYIQLGGIYNGFIEIKEDSYTVTVSQIKVTNAYDPNISLDISEYLIKRNALKESKSNIKTLKMLNDYFNGIFTFSKADK